MGKRVENKGCDDDMDGSDGFWLTGENEAGRKIDLVMEQHEAYLRRRAAKAEAKRREKQARRDEAQIYHAPGH